MESNNFKTPSYQRKAYNAYIQRKKEDSEKYEEFKEKLKASQKKYYLKNKQKILEKKASEREARKKNSNTSEDELLTFDLPSPSNFS